MSKHESGFSTPEEIASAQFETRRRGGFDPDAVREYLASVATAMRDILDERDGLAQRLASAEGELADVSTGSVATPTDPVELDEATLTEQLGQHAARVLSEAKAAAEDRIREAEREADEIRAAAEELHAERSVEADQAAQRIRDEAETLKSERTAEAEAVAAEIVARAEATATEAAQLSSSSQDEARAESDRIIHEAELMRRQILEDLARRRSAARRQIEQLRAGRERLMSSHETVRRALDEITEELAISMSEARAAAETAGHSVSDTTIEELEAEIETARLSGLLDTGPVPVVATKPPAEAKAEASEPQPEPQSEGESSEAEETPEPEPAAAQHVEPAQPAELDDAVESEEPADAGDPTESDEPASTEEPESEPEGLAKVVSLDAARSDVDTGGHPASGREAGSRKAAAESDEPKARPSLEAVSSPALPSSRRPPVAVPDPKEVSTTADGAEDTGTEDDDDADSVDDLFASLRTTADEKAEKAEKASAKKKTTKASAKKKSKKPKAKKPSGPSAAAKKRVADEVDLDEVTRRIKRVLADEQSKVMSRVKAAEEPPTVDDLLGSPEEHVAGYWDVVREHLADHQDPATTRVPIEDMAADVRRRVDEAISGASVDVEASLDSLRSIYREVKTRNVDTCVEQIVERAASAPSR